ncbi:hypothetical protein BABINDRAFT_51071 [Babjeviella inositovora NRRL Y-12698]|uniref:Sm protein B n=1 Tax=Babjeviella inositovora NRRL Y-12698 TaxID=984486 RepID=A0A1E3QNX1_9ASCO|nr:uncharacterized protein BABINDRAFT_51071 [Babjeviella inositovora NRRL Y-12698]ODQ79144.1 hypothetical protein BABINDRAFT_51071 [Babjeviella inositovora NRRL Y-12698]
MNVSRKTKMADLVNYRIKVTTSDSRQLSGQLLSFDKHMNLVLADCEEYRITKKSLQELKEASRSNNLAPTKVTEQKRVLGLVILRGEQVVSLVIESPPPADPRTRLGATTAGSGTIKQFKSAVPAPSALAASLAAPVRTNNFTGAPKVFTPPPGFQGGFKR